MHKPITIILCIMSISLSLSIFLIDHSGIFRNKIMQLFQMKDEVESWLLRLLVVTRLLMVTSWQSQFWKTERKNEREV